MQKYNRDLRSRSCLLIPVTGDMMQLPGFSSPPVSEPINMDNESVIFEFI